MGKKTKASGPAEPAPVSLRAGGIAISLCVKPGAQESSVVEVGQDAVHVRIAAPPRDGEANGEVVRFVARLLGVPKTQVCLAHGQRSRAKTVEVQCAGLTVEGVAATLRASIPEK